MKKEKQVRQYTRRTKSGKVVTVKAHTAKYDAAEELKKAMKKKGAGEELSKKKAEVEENPLGFSADDYKEWYHWDMEDDANNEAALRVEKALIKKMGKRAYNKYLKDMTDSYSARGHKKAHQALLDEHTASQKKQDAESSKAAKDIARGSKEKVTEEKELKRAKSRNSNGTLGKENNLIRSQGDYVRRLMSHYKDGELNPMMGSYIAAEKKILEELKRHKGSVLSAQEIDASKDAIAKKHKLSYEEDGVYSDKSGKTYRISTNPITGKSTLHPMVGSTLGATEAQIRSAGRTDTNAVDDKRLSSIIWGVKSTKSSTTTKKKETKGDRAVSRMNKLVNEALSSTTSDPKALKKQLRALIDYNGGPLNYGDKIGKRIDEIREQLGKRSSKKRVDKKSDYDYETSMKNLENYFAEERRKSTSKAKTQSSTAPTKKRLKGNEPISEQSLNSRGFKTFKMPQIGTLYLGKRGKGAYIRFKGKKTIQKATIDDYEDFITGHNGLTKAQKKQLSSLGYTEHEEY